MVARIFGGNIVPSLGSLINPLIIGGKTRALFFKIRFRCVILEYLFWDVKVISCRPQCFGPFILARVYLNCHVVPVALMLLMKAF